MDSFAVILAMSQSPRVESLPGIRSKHSVLSN
jgi:hypothetical protein